MNIKKEIMEEFRKEFTEPLGGVFVIKTMNPLELEQWLSQALTRIEEAERERIAKAMQPAFDDFNAAGQRMIEVGSLKRTGTEIIENIGYMKSVLLSPSEEKECKHHCHSCEQYRLNGDCWCDDLYEHEPTCIHCHSPKKEKRGR